MSDIRDKVVLVTGGSGGLGRALGRAFVDAGYRVVLTARSQAKLQLAAQAIDSAQERLLALTCDVTNKDQVVALGEQIHARWGGVQILINNAGIARAVSFLDMTDAQWEEILRTNITGTYNCCKVFLPDMIKQKWGRVINIGSTTCKVAYTHVSAYTTSKHGLLGLTRSLALESARHGVTVNAICPGYLDNELTRDNARRMAQKTGRSEAQILATFAASAPQNRLIEPGEVANLALLMASEKMAGMTGQAINVDGGAVMA
ncbi:MAG: SDR family oxidoreductase [Deltaproteobacteria bacterium]|nr:SDR family oxidoreductase [Deltaproteobacteria bacterium]